METKIMIFIIKTIPAFIAFAIPRVRNQQRILFLLDKNARIIYELKTYFNIFVVLVHNGNKAYIYTMVSLLHIGGYSYSFAGNTAL